MLSLFTFAEFLGKDGYGSTTICDSETGGLDSILAKSSTVLFYFSIFALWHTVLKVMIPGLPTAKSKSFSDIQRENLEFKDEYLAEKDCDGSQDQIIESPSTLTTCSEMILASVNIIRTPIYLCFHFSTFHLLTCLSFICFFYL